MATHLLYELDDCNEKTCDIVPWPLKNRMHTNTLSLEHVAFKFLYL